MRLGAIFPQKEIGADPAAVRDYAQAAEDLGYAHLLVYDHVLGADASRHEGWNGLSHIDMFHEPFVLFGFLGAVTKKIEMATGILILGQRQTALVAKQAAQADMMTGGRVRLGIGIGWNAVEYEALGEDFNDRARRFTEQVELMRALWTNDVVNFEGKYHRVTHAGINPLPVQRPIPVWLGGYSDQVLRRTARIGDGLIPQFAPDDAGRERIARMQEYAVEIGRDPTSIGIDGFVYLTDPLNTEQAHKEAQAWADLGATHLSLNTMNLGLQGPDQHIEAIRRFKEEYSG